MVPSVGPIILEGDALVRSIRNADGPFEVSVGGGAAQLVDVKDGLFSRLPLALGIIGGPKSAIRAWEMRGSQDRKKSAKDSRTASSDASFRPCRMDPIRASLTR